MIRRLCKVTRKSIDPLSASGLGSLCFCLFREPGYCLLRQWPCLAAPQPPSERCLERNFGVNAEPEDHTKCLTSIISIMQHIVLLFSSTAPNSLTSLRPFFFQNTNLQIQMQPWKLTCRGRSNRRTSVFRVQLQAGKSNPMRKVKARERN